MEEQKKTTLDSIYEEAEFASFCLRGKEVRIVSDVKPGQDLVAAGYVGLAGTLWMALHREELLRKTLPEDYVESGRELPSYIGRLPCVADAVLYGASAVAAVAEGGIFRCLWELAQAVDKGIYTRLKDIPVRQQTIEFCEVFDLNPYRLWSGGCLLMAVENGCDAVLRLEQSAVPCAVIGKITGNRDRVAAYGGTCRYLTRPQRDEIYKLL